MHRIRDGHLHPVADVLATEEPLEIRVERRDGREPERIRLSVTMRTPGNDFELVAGFLFTEGIVPSADSLARIEYVTDLPGEQQHNVVNVVLDASVHFDADVLRRNFTTTSSCGVCGKGSLEALVVQGCRPPSGAGPLVRAATLCGLQDSLRAAQRTFQQTGGLHAAGLFDAEGRLLALREDVGRHNALDKLVGERLLAGDMPLADRVLMVSGRTSFEIMQKAAMAGIPLVVGVGAPSSLAVDTARAFGMTLIGFLRPDGFNVYANARRIRPDP
ncbi:MAG: formate dehydrogenase accessory sulfurtransferase FdhD [Chloroflexi bacterium]|nr:formate dehydrogenase accessory sulfurtransferase FdhD [Chloroflexota bacterium]